MDWIKAVLAFFGIIKKTQEMIHDHGVDVAGQNKIIAADLKDANDAAKKALEAANNTDSDAVDGSLRRGDY